MLHGMCQILTFTFFFQTYQNINMPISNMAEEIKLPRHACSTNRFGDSQLLKSDHVNCVQCPLTSTSSEHYQPTPQQVGQSYSRAIWCPRGHDLNLVNFCVWIIVKRETNQQCHNIKDSMNATIVEMIANLLPRPHRSLGRFYSFRFFFFFCFVFCFLVEHAENFVLKIYWFFSFEHFSFSLYHFFQLPYELCISPVSSLYIIYKP